MEIETPQVPKQSLLPRLLRWRLSQKIWYGLGHVFNDLSAAMWFSYMLLFFKVIIRMDAAAAGAMLMLGQVMDAVATPIIGYLADRYGDKKMWHLTGTTMIIVSFPILFMRCAGCTPTNPDTYLSWWMPTYYAILVVLFQAGWAVVQISHLSMIPDFTDNLAVRSELTSIRYTATVCSSIMVYIITWMVLSTNYSKNIDPDADYKFRNVAAIISCLGFASSLLFFNGFRTKTRHHERDSKHAKTNGSIDVENNNNSNHHSKPPQLAKKAVSVLKSPLLFGTSMLYVCSRLYWALSLVYIPLYLEERLTFNPDEGSETVASVPLVLYISSFFSSLILKYKISSCGNEIAYLIGIVLCLISSVWIGYEISPDASTSQIFIVAALMGAGCSISNIASLCFTADLIGTNSNESAIVYSIVTFADKLVTGIAVVVVEYYKCEDSTDCPQYYRGIITYVCGSFAVLGLLSLVLTKIKAMREAT